MKKHGELKRRGELEGKFKSSTLSLSLSSLLLAALQYRPGWSFLGGLH